MASSAYSKCRCLPQPKVTTVMLICTITRKQNHFLTHTPISLNKSVGFIKKLYTTIRELQWLDLQVITKKSRQMNFLNYLFTTVFPSGSATLPGQTKKATWKEVLSMSEEKSFQKEIVLKAWMRQDST